MVTTTKAKSGQQATARTAKEARAERFVSWAETVGYSGVVTERLSQPELDQLLMLQRAVAVYERRDVGNGRFRSFLVEGRLELHLLSDEERGRWERLLAKARARHAPGTRPHDPDSVASRTGRLAKSFLEAEVEDAFMEPLREWARSSATISEILASKLLGDDLEAGAIDVLDVGVFVCCLHRLQSSGSAIGVVANAGANKLPIPDDPTREKLGDTLDRLTVSDWLETSPPSKVGRRRGKQWRFSVGPRAAAAGDQSRRWRELALRARGKLPADATAAAAD